MPLQEEYPYLLSVVRVLLDLLLRSQLWSEMVWARKMELCSRLLFRWKKLGKWKLLPLINRNYYSGEPQVTDILPVDGVSESELLILAYILEKKSEHPLAKAITGRVESEVEQSEREKLTEVSDFQAVPGNGLSGKIGGAEVLGGNLNYIGQHSEVSEEMKHQAEHLSEQGKKHHYSSVRTEHLWESLQWLMSSKKTAQER